MDAGWAGVVVPSFQLRFEGTAVVKAASEQQAMRLLGQLMPDQVRDLLVWPDGQPKPVVSEDS